MLDISFQHIVFHGFGGEKYDRHFSIAFPDLPGEGKAVFFWHHYIKNAKVKVAVIESNFTSNTISGKSDVIFMHFEIGPKNISKILVVLYK